MKKILIIIKREYLVRVRKKSFILMTILVPVLFVGVIALIAGISISSIKQKHVVVVDESGYFKQKLDHVGKIAFQFSDENPETLRKDLSQGTYDAVLHIPPFDVDKEVRLNLYSEEQLGMEAQSKIEDEMNDILVQERLSKAGITRDQLNTLENNTISLVPIDKEGKESSSVTAFGIGYACGFLLYMFMLFYGMSVMRSVMEEKTNRIAEIIVSSVKPFQLMLGKIIGVAMVGLTQVLFWLVIGVIAATVLGSMFGMDMATSDPEAMRQMAAQAGGEATIMQGFSAMLASTNWVAIILWFLFYFLAGYLLYASLFAAVGSLVNEDPQESNQFTLPITIPIILGFVLMTSALRDPHSGLAIFGSLFPLTSPIVMMARIPFGVPAWQLILSAILLILGFLGTTWMAGKIYRTGILLYGKKVTMKEVGKWLVRK